MSKEINNEKTISGKTLKEKLLIKENRTIASYIEEGALPKPIKEIESGNLLFDKQEVLKMLGAKSFNEEFINTESVADLLDVTASTVQSFARKGLLPSYRLKNVKGSQILFLRSEVEAAKQYTIQWQISFGNNLIIKSAIKTIFSKLLNERSSLLTQREMDILKMVLLEDKKPEEIAGKCDLTSERIKQIFQHGIKRLYIKMDAFTDALNKKPEMQREINDLTNQVNLLEAKLNLYDETKKRRSALPEETQLLLNVGLEDFDISVRALNILNNENIKTVEDLVKIKRTDFLKLRNAGKKGADELEAFLISRGLAWNMKL